MTQFVGINPDDTLDVNAYYRVVIESVVSLWPDFAHFRDAANVVFTNMFGRTGVLTPVSPNPVTPADDTSSYVIDIGLINSAGYDNVTALEAVRRIEGISNRVGVRSFIALASVDDVRDNGPAERGAIQAQVQQQKQAESPLNSIGHWLTLVVVAVVALAAIQISKDL